MRQHSGELGAGPDAELGVDARQVVLDGLDRQEERARDLLVGLAAGNELGDGPLALGEHVAAGPRAQGAGADADPLDECNFAAGVDPARTAAVYVRNMDGALTDPTTNLRIFVLFG